MLTVMSRLAVVALLAVASACGDKPVDVTVETDADYNHGELQQAVDKFVAAGRTANAYGELARTALQLRAGMDRSVGDEAELKLVVLALGPIQAVATQPMEDQVDVLATTVWPTLLAPRIEADAILLKRDPRSAELFAKPGEEPAAYLQRLCGGPLAGECKQVVPEYQGAAVAAVAIRRGTERARNAVASCMACGANPQWHESVRQWETLDRLANGWIHDVESRATPDNWPIAGNASEPDPRLPEAEVNAIGELVIGDTHPGPNERVAALRKLRGRGNAIAVHLRPELSLAQVKVLLADAKTSGAAKIAIVARGHQYPWERRVYWLSDAGKIRANLRPEDTLQLFVHTLDHVAGPGAVARVD